MCGHHLIKKKVKMYLGHFTDDRKEFTDPHVDLITCQRVENPLVVVIEKLGEPSGIAVVLAVLVISGVFVDGVEDIDWESHSKEIVVLHVHQVGQQLAVVVEEQERRKRPREVPGKRGVEEELRKSQPDIACRMSSR